MELTATANSVAQQVITSYHLQHTHKSLTGNQCCAQEAALHARHHTPSLSLPRLRELLEGRWRLLLLRADRRNESYLGNWRKDMRSTAG